MKKIIHTIKSRARSISFDKDPTVEVDSLSSAFIWRTIFSRLPSTPILESTALSSHEVEELLQCAILSRVIYKDPSQRYFPPNLSNIVYESTESDYYRIPYLIINSDELDTIYVVCRGSYCVKDFLVDFMAATVTYRGGQCHEGVFLTAHNLFHSVKPIVKKLSDLNNNRKIVITGHSLGGGVAAMCAEFFKAEINDINVKAVCFAPVASFSSNIWEMTNYFIKTYVLDGDFVPFISFYNAINLPKDSMPTLFKTQLDKAIQKRINRHAHQPEFQDIIETKTQIVNEPYQLFPPGNAFLIKLVDEENGKIEIQKIHDHKNYFGQFVRELNELRHRMKIYKTWVTKYTVDFYQGDPEIIDYYDLNRKKAKKLKRPFKKVNLFDQFVIPERKFFSKNYLSD